VCLWWEIDGVMGGGGLGVVGKLDHGFGFLDLEDGEGVVEDVLEGGFGGE
jgi:hypothetical protein